MITLTASRNGRFGTIGPLLDRAIVPNSTGLMAALIVALWLTVTPALAQEPAAAPNQPLVSAAQEARAQALFDELRCVVCQHESIADSPAGIAGDMRRLVREQIAAGSTDTEVKADMVRRYGDYVLFRPPVRGGTWLLWFGPLALVVIGGGALWAFARRRPVETTALTPDEEARLDEVIRNDRFGPDDAASSPHDGRSVKATGTGADVGTTPHRPISDG